MNVYTKTLICLAVTMVLIAPSCAQPTTPFVINGWVFYEDGTTPCDDPVVNITNLDTGAEWQAETNTSYNYYQIMLANGTDLNVSEILRFSVTSPGEDQSNVTEYIVTHAEVDAGGFECNITLAPHIVINEFVANPSSGGNDWVELYNPTGGDISLDGWALNDSLTTSHMKSLSGTINASGYRVFEVSNRLDKNDDIITLLNGTTVVDEVTYGSATGNAPVPTTNESAGRYPNGEDTDVDSNDFTIFDTPTPEAENVLGDTTPVSVEMGDHEMSPSGNLTAPIMLQNITGYGTATITLEYNESVVNVTDVANGSFSTVLSHNINNTAGTVRISAQNMSGVDGDIEFARITFEAVGVDGDTTQLNLSVQLLWDIPSYNKLANHTSNGSITLTDGTPPVISNENATPGKIIQTIIDGRDRNVSRNITTLSVNVTDTGGSGVKNVTINLTLIGGSANTSMTNGGSGDIYSVDTTATDGINSTHSLVVTARDNNNTATSNITLEVLRRGDVARNGNVDIGDALYIARYTVGLEPPADNWLLVGDVVGEGGNEPGDDSVDMGDALFISRYTVGLEDEP